MSIMLTGTARERRHASTMNIDRLSTLDMLNVIHQDDAQISSALTPHLSMLARVVDNAAATLSHGGRLVLIGAGASGGVAKQAAEAFAPGKHPVIAMTAGDNAGSYARGVADLQTIKFGEHDMMLALSVSGKTPWVWGAMRHAWSLAQRSRSLRRMRKVKRRSWRAWLLPPIWARMWLPGIPTPKRALRKA